MQCGTHILNLLESQTFELENVDILTEESQNIIKKSKYVLNNMTWSGYFRNKIEYLYSLLDYKENDYKEKDYKETKENVDILYKLSLAVNDELKYQHYKIDKISNGQNSSLKLLNSIHI